MIRKLRWKFIGILMSFVTVILLAVFVSVAVSTRKGMEQTCISMLHRVINDNPSPGPPQKNRQEMQLPYFILSIDKNDVIRVINGRTFDLEDKEQLKELIELGLMGEENAGMLKDYDFRYLRQRFGNGWRIAYADVSSEKTVMSNLLLNSLKIGFASLLLFFFVSLWLSKWAIRPVEQAWEQQKQFVADAYHELKTPLTVILSNADLLLSDAQILSAQQIRRAENIKIEGQRMNRLVEDLLHLAQTDAFQTKEVFSQVNFSDLVMDSLLTFEPVFYDSGKQLHYQVAENLTLLGNVDTLKRLTAILLDNARKYAPEGSLITVSLTETPKRQAVLKVANSGDVIPPDKLDKLFERFYRLDPSRESHGGYGLGLSIARSIVESHKGRIWAESSLQDGNVFYVSLPLISSEA